MCDTTDDDPKGSKQNHFKKEILMLNVIKSIIATMISLFIALISFIRGPILVGLVIGASILAFASEASAATQPTFVSLSFSETFAVVTIALALIGAIILFIKESN